MAIRFADLKDSILLILYDYMLTSDHEGFWYGIPAIEEALPPNTSGAFVQRALKALKAAGLIEEGGTEVWMTDLYALSDRGISKAEELIEERGLEIEEYEPAPEADLILSRFEDPDQHKEISDELKELSAQVKASNSLDESTGGNADLIKGEIDAAEVLMSSDRVRVGRLKSLIVPSLRYLATKFADETIGELAKRLLALILGLGS